LVSSIQCKFPVMGKVRFTFSDRPLHEFCLRHFHYYRPTCIDEDLPMTEYAEIVFEDVADLLPEALFQTEQIIGRRFSIKSGTIQIEKKMRSRFLQYEFSEKGKAVVCRINHLGSPLVFQAYKILKSEYGRVHEAFYEIAINPLAAMFHLIGGFFAVHAMMVHKENKTLLFYGLDGVGKSTLTAKFVENGWTFCSDNVCFFDGRQAFGLTLPIRLGSEHGMHEMETAKKIFSNSRLIEVVLPEFDTGCHRVDHLYHMVLSNGKIRKALADGGDFVPLLSAYGALETNLINTFLAGFSSLRTPSGEIVSNNRGNHEVFGNEIGNIENSLQGVL